MCKIKESCNVPLYVECTSKPTIRNKNGLGDIHKTDGRLFADVVSHSETLNGVVILESKVEAAEWNTALR